MLHSFYLLFSILVALARISVKCFTELVILGTLVLSLVSKRKLSTFTIWYVLFFFN